MGREKQGKPQLGKREGRREERKKNRCARHDGGSEGYVHGKEIGEEWRENHFFF